MKNLKILIVEDELLIAEEIQYLLESIGYEVAAVVAKGEDAINVVKKQALDLILMDIHLAGEMNGIETVKEIQQISDKDIPIIYITDAKDPLTVGQAVETNPVNYIPKPFTSRHLNIAIELAFKKALLKSQLPISPHIKTGYHLNDSLFVKEPDGHKFMRVDLEHLYWIQAQGKRCELVTNEKKVLINVGITELIVQFRHPNLLQISRSIVINVDKVDSFMGNCIYLSDPQNPEKPQELLIGKTYRSQVQDYFHKIVPPKSRGKKNKKK